MKQNVFEQSPKTKHREPSSFDNKKNTCKSNSNEIEETWFHLGENQVLPKKKKSFLTFYFN